MTSSAPLYPIALRLEGLACLVVGAGPVAARKAASLVECGARVTVIAPEVCPEMEEISARVVRRPYVKGDAARFRLVIAATGVAAVDRAVFRDAEDSGVLVNGADDVQACRFFLPALLRRGPVTVAVSTAGVSPFLAGWLRDRIAEVVGPEFSHVASLVGEARRSLRQAGRPTEGADWGGLIDDELAAVVAAGSGKEARSRLERWLTRELGRNGGQNRE